MDGSHRELRSGREGLDAALQRCHNLLGGSSRLDIFDVNRLAVGGGRRAVRENLVSDLQRRTRGGEAAGN